MIWMAKRPINSAIKAKEFLLTDNEKILWIINHPDFRINWLLSQDLVIPQGQSDIYFDHVLPILSVMEIVWSITSDYRANTITDIVRKITSITESVDFENILSMMLYEYNFLDQWTGPIISLCDLATSENFVNITKHMPALIVYNGNKLWSEQIQTWKIDYLDIGQHSYSKAAIIKSSDDENYQLIDFDRVLGVRKYKINRKLFTKGIREGVIHGWYRILLWLKNVSRLSLKQFELHQDVKRISKDSYHIEKMRSDERYRNIFNKLTFIMKSIGW